MLLAVLSLQGKKLSAVEILYKFKGSATLRGGHFRWPPFFSYWVCGLQSWGMSQLASSGLKC